MYVRAPKLDLGNAPLALRLLRGKPNRRVRLLGRVGLSADPGPRTAHDFAQDHSIVQHHAVPRRRARNGRTIKQNLFVLQAAVRTQEVGVRELRPLHRPKMPHWQRTRARLPDVARWPACRRARRGLARTRLRQRRGSFQHARLQRRADRRRQRVRIRHTAHVVEILQIFQIDRQIDVPAQLFFTDLAPMRKQRTS